MKTRSIVDQLGTLRATIAELQAKYDTIKTKLTEQGPGEYEGDLFRATVGTSIVARIDWTAIAKKLRPSAQLVSAHTTKKPQTRVTVSARRRDAA